MVRFFLSNLRTYQQDKNELFTFKIDKQNTNKDPKIVLILSGALWQNEIGDK